MEILQSIFSNTIIAFIILIGVVVFVHELGHFIAGKAFGIEVEEFSIGFGPKAFSIRKGNTDYRINWLPLGGYVRFYGSDIEQIVPLEKREKSFLHAKVHKRAIVSFAGPFANFVLSFIVMTFIYFHGLPFKPATSYVLPNSVAEKSGLKTGDKILAIDNKKIENWSDLSAKINSSPEKNLSLQIESNGLKKELKITPSKEEIETALGNKQSSGRIGISALFNSSHVHISKNSFFQAIGLQNGDQITRIQDKNIQFFYEITQKLESITQSQSDYSLAEKIHLNKMVNEKFEIEFLRLNKKETIHVSLNDPNIKKWSENYLINKSNQKIDWSKDLISSDQTISNYQAVPNNDKLIPAIEAWKNCGLKTGDTIYSIEGVGRIFSILQIYSWLDTAPKSLQLNQNKTDKLNVQMQVFNKNGNLENLKCSIPLRNGFDHLNRAQVFMDFPIQFMSQSVTMPNEISKAISFSEAVQKGYNAVLNQLYLTYNAIKMLFTGSIPLSNLGGPIAIANVAGEAAKGGFIIFLMTMAFISTNIGMMNLLPLPALDGGYLFLNAVEAAFGKPLPKSVQITVQRIGIFIILGLFIIVFYNDILRLIRF